jgi:hypothetical protein
MGTDKPAWLSDNRLSLAEKKQRLKREYPHIVKELRREFYKKHKGPQEKVKTKVKILAGI